MHSDNGRVDHLNGCVMRRGQRAHDPAPDTSPPPADEVKGAGEAGTVGALSAGVNAIVDALSVLGIKHIDMPCTPYRVWQAIQDALTGNMKSSSP
jgi:hypothetical protein